MSGEWAVILTILIGAFFVWLFHGVYRSGTHIVGRMPYDERKRLMESFHNSNMEDLQNYDNEIIELAISNLKKDGYSINSTSLLREAKRLVAIKEGRTMSQKVLKIGSKVKTALNEMTSRKDKLDKLKELKELYDNGALTEDEFEQFKKNILSD